LARYREPSEKIRTLIEACGNRIKTVRVPCEPEPEAGGPGRALSGDREGRYADRMRWARIGVAGIALACGTTPSNNDTADTGEAGVDDVRECGIETDCEVFLGAGSCYEPNCDWTEYLPAHVCALQALASGAPALIDFSDGCEGQCYGSLVLLRGAAGQTSVQSYYDEFEERVTTDMRACQLQEPAYFSQCLEQFDVDCLELSSWFVACEDVDQLGCTAMQ
jgi:hypothetical protein